MVKKVSSKAGEHVLVMKGKEQIGKAFADYLVLFDVVYHLKNDCRAQRQHPLCQRRLRLLSDWSAT